MEENLDVIIKWPLNNGDIYATFDTWQEYVSILKNKPNQTWIDWLERFEIFLGDVKQEYREKMISQSYTEDEFFDKMIQAWEHPYDRWIPKWTREELWANIDSIPAITEQEIMEKYKGEQLIIALSFIENKTIIKLKL